MICSTLLNTEGAGLEYTLSLPLRGRTIVNAKALIASLTYTPVPIVLFFIGLSKQASSPYILLVPFVEAISVVAACTFQIAFFVKPRVITEENDGHEKIIQSEGFSIMAGSDVKRLLESFAISSTILLIPIISYAVTYLVTFNHALSIGVQTSISATELMVILTLVRRAVK